MRTSPPAETVALVVNVGDNVGAISIFETSSKKYVDGVGTEEAGKLIMIPWNSISSVGLYHRSKSKIKKTKFTVSVVAVMPVDISILVKLGSSRSKRIGRRTYTSATHSRVSDQTLPRSEHLPRSIHTRHRQGNLVSVRRGKQYEDVNYQAMEFAREEIDLFVDLQRSSLLENQSYCMHRRMLISTLLTWLALITNWNFTFPTEDIR